MPNRTIYLPEELDQASRRLNLNLSRVVQDAIRNLVAASSPDSNDNRVDAASRRALALGIDWTGYSLEDSRDAARER